MSELVPGPSQEAVAPRIGVPLQTRGAVQTGALYVARRVDEALLAALRQGRWAVVLGSRFSGKSSLRMRTTRALQPTTGPLELEPGVPAATYRCATIEARTLQSASAGALYLALCTTLAAELRLPAVSNFWQRYSDEPPAERFRRYLLEEVTTAAARTVVLIDDIDALQALPIELPELLAALGQVQDALAAAGSAGALALVLFSSLPLERLTAAADSARWAGARFLLPDFTRTELSAFGPALAALVRDADPAMVQDWLDAVFAWTAGHPQLTQHVCQQLVARAPAPAAASLAPTGEGSSEGVAEPVERVERLIQTLFLDQDDAVHEEPCLREMAQGLTRSPQAQALLALYRRLLSGGPVTPDPLDGVQRELRLCGLASEADDAAGTPRLRPRCRLVATLLGEAWAREHEVRLVLKDAIAREGAADQRAPAVTLLRGVPLKTAQAWARKHPEALSPPEVRVLLASLEAARSEAEAKHQATAATLQRELRDKNEIRYPGGPAPARIPSSPARPGPGQSGLRVAVAAIGLSLCLVAVALASAHRRSVRLQQATAEAAARAVRAEQALAVLRAEQARRTLSAERTLRVSGPASDVPAALRRPDAPQRAVGPAQPGPDYRKPGVPAQTAARPLLLFKTPPAGHAAAREPGTCPVPGRSAD